MPSAKRNPRIDQLLASLGYGSRKEITTMVKEGRVSVEGRDNLRADMRVDPHSILIDGVALDHPCGLLILMNKPRDYVCSHNPAEGASVYELLPHQWNFRSPAIESIGRLDKDTSGLLLLTDKHDLIHLLTSPKHHVDKVYEAEVENDLHEKMIDIFSSGTLLLEGETKSCLVAKLEILDKRHARITVNEGRFHQVRRMFSAVGAPVLTLRRIQFGDLKLGELEESSYQLLEPDLSSVIGKVL